MAVVFAAATFAAPIPLAQLTNKLYAAPFRKTELPGGFYTAKVLLGEKAKNAVGRVNIVVDGTDLIAYSIYPSPVTAAKRLSDPKLEGEGSEKMRLVGSVPGWGKQSHMYVGSVSGENVFGKKVTNGVTMLMVLRGPVIVMAFSVSTESEQSGDMQDARKLLLAGVKHLDRVRGK